MRIIGPHPLITFLYVFVGSYHGSPVVIMFRYWTSAQEFIDVVDSTISAGSNSTLHCVAIQGALPAGRSLSSKSKTPTKCKVLTMNTKVSIFSHISGLGCCKCKRQDLLKPHVIVTILFKKRVKDFVCNWSCFHGA